MIKFRSKCFLVGILMSLACQYPVHDSYAQTLPVPDHIVIVIYENLAYSQVYNSSLAPHINALCNDTNAAVFSQYFAVEHPSQPNYLDIFSGSNQGITNDSMPTGIPFTSPNLAAGLIGASRTFITYCETMPGIGYMGETSGLYAHKHNPASNWIGSGQNQLPVNVSQPFTYFPISTNYSSLPTVSYVIPNMVNDMHNGSVPAGDNWMFSKLDTLKQWALANNTLYILTFDEDDDFHNNQILTVFYGPMVKGGSYPEHINHFDLLRTIEQMYGLNYTGAASTATTITDCWRSFTGISKSVYKGPQFSVYPNPASNSVSFTTGNQPQSNISIHITDVLGRNAGNFIMDENKLTINTSLFIPGVYYYNICNGMENIEHGKFMISR